MTNNTNTSSLKTSTTVPTRKSYILQGTFSTNNAKLDFRSHLFLRWADKWTTSSGGLKTTHSGLVRRALSLYSIHLAALPLSEVGKELRAIKDASGRWGTSQEDQEAAEARLQAACAGCESPLVSFEVVFKGQAAINEVARIQEHLKQFNHSPIKPINVKTKTTTTTNKQSTQN